MESSKILILGPQKWPVYPIFGLWNELFIIIQNHHYYPLFNTFHQVQSWRKLINRFKEKLHRVLILGQKKCFPHFGHYSFSLKILQKNPINRFRKKSSKMRILGPKMPLLLHFGQSKNLSEKSNIVTSNEFLMPVIRYLRKM